MEGTPVTILEAGASGLPVIATNHGGIPDVIESGKNGYLINENDTHGIIAELMIRLRNDSELVDRLGTYARVKVIEKFSLKDHINTMTEVITNTLNKTQTQHG